MAVTYTIPPGTKLTPKSYLLPYYCRHGDIFFMITTEQRMVEVTIHRGDRGITIQAVNPFIIHNAPECTRDEFMEAMHQAFTAINKQYFQLEHKVAKVQKRCGEYPIDPPDVIYH